MSILGYLGAVVGRHVGQARDWDEGRSAFNFPASIPSLSERPVDPLATQIGASVLVQTFFLPRDLWIPSPSDWSSNLTRGKTYATEEGTRRQMWDAIMAARVQVAQVSPWMRPGPAERLRCSAADQAASRAGGVRRDGDRCLRAD